MTAVRSEGMSSPAWAVSIMTVPRHQRNLFKGTGCARGFGFFRCWPQCVDEHRCRLAVHIHQADLTSPWNLKLIKWVLTRSLLIWDLLLNAEAIDKDNPSQGTRTKQCYRNGWNFLKCLSGYMQALIMVRVRYQCICKSAEWNISFHFPIISLAAL